MRDYFTLERLHQVESSQHIAHLDVLVVEDRMELADVVRCQREPAHIVRTRAQHVEVVDHDLLEVVEAILVVVEHGLGDLSLPLLRCGYNCVHRWRLGEHLRDDLCQPLEHQALLAVHVRRRWCLCHASLVKLSHLALKEHVQRSEPHGHRGHVGLEALQLFGCLRQ